LREKTTGKGGIETFPILWYELAIESVMARARVGYRIQKIVEE